MAAIFDKFKKNCDLFLEVFGDHAFKKYDSKSNKYKGQFFLGLFEATFVPVYNNFDYYEKNHEQLEEKVQEISGLKEFRNNTKHGIRSIDRMKKVFELGKEHFDDHQ